MSKLRILVACEFSGAVRRAFAARGHEAWSCDLLPAEDGSANHYQCDFRELDLTSFDFVGFHPDCRVMANSGVQWLDKKPGRRAELAQAASLFNECLRCKVPGYVENSIMHCHAKALIDRGQDQVVQPWWFGEPRFKATCLWLRGGIQPLVPTNKLMSPAPGTLAHKVWSAVHRASPGPLRWKERSRTLPGVAAAMAAAWG